MGNIRGERPYSNWGSLYCKRSSAGTMKAIPITEWLPKYQRANLRFDVIAGIALAGLLIPESMGYAGIAGLPPQAGLYATVFGLFGLRDFRFKPPVGGVAYVGVVGDSGCHGRATGCR